MPVIAGVSYEIIRLAGSSENPVVNVLKQTGNVGADDDDKRTG